MFPRLMGSGVDGFVVWGMIRGGRGGGRRIVSTVISAATVTDTLFAVAPPVLVIVNVAKYSVPCAVKDVIVSVRSGTGNEVPRVSVT